MGEATERGACACAKQESLAPGECVRKEAGVCVPVCTDVLT